MRHGGGAGLGNLAEPEGVAVRAVEVDVPRVLVIEDDEGLSDILVRALGADQFDLTVANRGSRGLELATAESFDLVILDLLLPDTDGISLLTRLMSVRPDQQVLVVSALSNVEAKVRCLDLGAADYLSKPFALDELVARARARLRLRSPLEERQILVRGVLRLDVQRRTTTCDGATIHLSTREFVLLEYLMRHEGGVCKREEILRDVWGYTHDPGTNVVDVYVRRLRRKIGELRIETIRNVGYSLHDA